MYKCHHESARDVCRKPKNKRFSQIVKNNKGKTKYIQICANIGNQPGHA